MIHPPSPLTALLLCAACAAPRLPGSGAGAGAAPQPPTAPVVPCGPYGDDTPPPRNPVEDRAWTAVARSLRTSARDISPSGALDRAARILASGAARGTPQPLARQLVQGALRAAGSFDPSPIAHLASGPADPALAALLARIGPEEATHAGVGAVEAGGVEHVVLLLARRQARLDPLPGATPVGAQVLLRGELLGLLHPRAYVTGPDGASAEIPLRGGQPFSATLALRSPGLHQVELIGSGRRGPEVAALVAIAVGGAACRPERPDRSAPEPRDAAQAEAAVVDSANRLRGTLGLPHLLASPPLAEVARRHSGRMLAARSVAHVLPGSGELVDRLAAGGVPFSHAYENVASGATTLEAHAAIEASPAHRANLLAADATTLGVGIARGTLPTGEPVVYLTEILVAPPAGAEGDRLTPDARVREALWTERARRGLPPLTNDLSLEALARTAALEMRARDSGEVDGLAAGALAMGRDLAAADAFIARTPDEALRSRNLTDERFRRVGVGVATGNSRRFGTARLFIAVLYSN